MNGLEIAIATKTYGDEPPVLQDLRVEIGDGEIAALFGPSGAGKTTLLKMIAGLDTRFEGSIAGGAAGDRTGTIGMVFQEPRLLPWLSVRDNVTLVLAEPESEPEWIDELLAAVHLSDRADALPGELSGGMQRRVALARAFAVRPQLLLLDEPFVSLDPPTASELRSFLLRLWRRLHPTVVLVSHDIEDAIALADRLLFLSRAPARVLTEQRLPPPETAGDRQQRRHIVEQLIATEPALLAGAMGNDPPAQLVQETG